MTDLDVEILLHLNARGGRNISVIAREIGRAYALIYSHVKKLRDKGLVMWSKKGRENFVEITPRGRKVLGKVMELLKEL